MYRFFVSGQVRFGSALSKFFSNIYSNTESLLLKLVLLKMPRITKPLTPVEVDRAKAGSKEKVLNDGKGLSLRVKPNGSKLWVFNYYRPYTQKRTNISFGTYPEVSLADAREQRRQARELIKKHIDPKVQRDEQYYQQQQAHKQTFETVACQWLELKRAKVSKSYADAIQRTFELYIIPEMGAIPVHKIRAKATIDVMQSLVDRDYLETIKRLCQWLNELMIFANNTGLVDNNPLAGIKDAFNRPEVEHMPSIPPAELPELMQKLASARMLKVTRCLFEWQLHTMVRPSEAVEARWSEIDFEQQLWVIPAERMKMKKLHIVPLTWQTMALLETMKPISGQGEYIYPASRYPNRPAGKQTINKALKRMGYEGRLVAHGFRAIASTAMNEQEFDERVIEAALAHVEPNSTIRAYNRAAYLEQRKPLMQWWSDFISSAADGDIRPAGGIRGLRAVN